MDKTQEFSQRLRAVMTRAGYPVRPVVLEREFNSRYWGKSVTLQGVRRWLQGEAIPAQDKIQVLAEWLKVEPEVLRFGEAVRQSVKQHQQLWESGMGHWERETCEAFLRLPAAQRKTAREVIPTGRMRRNPERRSAKQNQQKPTP